MSTSKNIQWPVYSANGKKIIKEGTIDGKPFKEIWKECRSWANEYCRRKFPDLIKTSKQEKKEIDELWKKLSIKQKDILKETKGSYIS